MEPDAMALADMIRVIDESVRALPESIAYIRLHRYMPAGAILLDRDEDGRLFGWASDEVLNRVPKVPYTTVGGTVTELVGIPIVRSAA